DALVSRAWPPATIASYSFDFGDGSAVVGPQTEPTDDHTYTFGGTYTVTLTVTDTAGRTATTTRKVTVTNGLVTHSSFEAGTAGWNTTGSGAGRTVTPCPGSQRRGSATTT